MEDTLQQLFAGKEPQEKVLELARPQLALVPLGYSVSLLLWDPHGPGTQLPFQSVIWQVIDTIFQELEALGGDTQSLQTVSLVQVSTHDKAWDLLQPDGRALQVMDVPPLGLMVEEATEIAVPDAQAAISAYARGLGAIPALFQGCAQQPLPDGRSAMQGAGSLFTLTVERELEGGTCQRSALRILVSPGATGPCPTLEPDTGCQPWIVEQLLEGNSLTFLLLCVSLPDTSREEILGALGLAERVKGLAKTISATLWDPAEEIAARRREIRGLRTELLAGAALPEQRKAVAQLRRALCELQVLKSQRWEKKRAVAEVLRSSEMHQPSDKVGRGQKESRSSQGGNSRAPAISGQELLEEPSQSKMPQPRPGGDMWDTARWQQEVAVLGLSLEAALREREAAEWDLEALLRNHHRELQACRQHLLQVLRDQQRLAEEQREALERRHRALLQEVLRDAVELAEHNRHLREDRQVCSADATTQTP
ncbi:hypothetical protein WISP_10342 [Willisornis vidua]|uniref:Uncharacterized protein n=1 Tax=Willisornis vidua TaxID=1566151 RepID=A0ABQ9DRI3_9PASS|nr:hypothetical protein WISP_10342 [Willisornis vidua]